MALILFEPLSKYAVVADIASDNPIAYLVDGTLVTDHPFTGKSLNFNAATNELEIPLGGLYTGQTIITQFWAFITNDNNTGLASSVGDLIWTLSTSNSTNLYHARLYINAFGLNLQTQASGSGYIASIPNPFVNNQWNYVEIKINVSETGSFDMRVNGAPVISQSGDFRRGTDVIGSLFLGGHDDYGQIADLIIMDSSGTQFNDFLGEFRTEISIPNGNGTTVAWTPTSGSNFTNIDDAVAAYDDDTTVISSSVADQVNLATHAATAATNQTAILFAGVSVLVKDNGVSPDDVQLSVRPSSTTFFAPTAVALDTTYEWRTFLWRTDPDTTLSWSLTGVNAAEFGVKSIA
jgi:hypothetical protein